MLEIFYNEMKKNHIEPNEVTYIALINQIKSCLMIKPNNPLALDALFNIITQLTNTAVADSRMIGVVRIALDTLYSNIHVIVSIENKNQYDIMDAVNKLYQWLMSSSLIRFDQLDENYW